MTLPLSIAQKLLLLQQTEKLPASNFSHDVVDELLQDGILIKQMQGRGKAHYLLASPHALEHYLHNRFGIKDLAGFVQKMSVDTATKSEAVETSSNSKARKIRSFTGFLVNCIEPVDVQMNDMPFPLIPQKGVFTYIADYTNFSVAEDVTIIGIENAENFNNLDQQAYLFTGIKALFVTRYPYSSDLVKWLQSIPNSYIHFGDYDFAGLNIFLNEYHRHFEDKASYFIPDNIEALFEQYGNRDLYNNQNSFELEPSHSAYDTLKPIIDLLHKHKKGLEQEILIGEK